MMQHFYTKKNKKKQKKKIIHFQTNTLRKDTEPFYPPSYGLNSINAILLGG